MGNGYGYNNPYGFNYGLNYGGIYRPQVPNVGGNGYTGGNGLSGLGNLGTAGLFGLGDLGTAGLFSAGAGLLGGLAGLLAGKTDAQKLAKRTYSMAQGRLGQDVLHPEGYLASYQRARLPIVNAQAGRLNRQFGLDSGVAQGALFQQIESPLAQFLLQARQRNDELKSANDNSLLALMGQLSQAV